jgi:hypothetical protein
VAHGIVRAIVNDARGQTFELAGPDVLSTRQLAEWVRIVLKMPSKYFYELAANNETHHEILWYGSATFS